ncbi:MAG: hypothetical protein R3Y38_02705 [Rikenellaceae bacterium]
MRDNFLQILFDSLSIVGVIILVVLVITFGIQLYYYFGSYLRILKFSPKAKTRQVDGISVVILVEENESFFSELMPRLVTQDYENYEIMLVDVIDNNEISSTLEILSANNPKIKVTTLSQKNSHNKISNKMAYNLGIKAAKYENIVITTADALPCSTKWLRCMAEGFETSSVVIAYSGIEKGEGFNNKLMRCSRLSQAMRYLSLAIKGRTYRGSICNLGFTREQYFKASGFNFLNLNIGEDDLFIQKIATKDNTAVILDPDSVVNQPQLGNLRWWRKERMFLSVAFKYYLPWVKRFIRGEMLTRFLFFALIAASVIILPLYYKIFVVSLFLIRSLISIIIFNKIAKKLGEDSLKLAFFVYDIFALWAEIRLWVLRKIKPLKGVWR